MISILCWSFLCLVMLCGSGCIGYVGQNFWESGYVVHTDRHLPGWTCPADRSHWVTYIRPTCGWAGEGVITKSCRDEEEAAIEKAGGCAPPTTTASASAPAAQPTPEPPVN
jgi:hypothetical protein